MSADNSLNTVTATRKTSGEHFLHDIHTAVRKKLASKSGRVPPSLQVPTNELRDKIRRCVTHGEKFTLLLMGPPGSGKSTVLDAAAQAVNSETDGAVEVVKVDAPMHRDDESSVRSIVRQLSHLLGCLDRTKKVRNFQDNLSLLQMLLKDSWSLHKAVVIVLDHFERFCGPARQTLLYSLFDLLHVAKLQICVIGVTSVLNVTDGLEKRIKSRCNLQRLYISGPQGVDEIKDLAAQQLHLEEQDLPVYEEAEDQRQVTNVVEAYNKILCDALSDSELLAHWNLEFATGRDPRWFLQGVALSILNLVPGEVPATKGAPVEVPASVQTSNDPSRDSSADPSATPMGPKKKRRVAAADKPGINLGITRRPNTFTRHIISLPAEVP